MLSYGSMTKEYYAGRSLHFFWKEISRDYASRTSVIEWQTEYSMVYGNLGGGMISNLCHCYVDVSGTIAALRGTWYGNYGEEIEGHYPTAIHNDVICKGTATIGWASYAANQKGFPVEIIQELIIPNENPASLEYDIVTVTMEGTQYISDLPYRPELTVSNGTLGTRQYIGIPYQPDSMEYDIHLENYYDHVHKIKYFCGSESGYIAGSDTGYLWSASGVYWTPPLSLAYQNTTSTTVTVKLRAERYHNQELVSFQEYEIPYAMPTSIAPTGSITVTDAAGYLQRYGYYVKGLSRFDISVSGTPSYGAPIATYSITANGETQTGAESTLTTDELANAGNLTISAKVTDTRERSVSLTKSAYVEDYSKPFVTRLTVHRCDADGTENFKGEYVKVEYEGRTTSLDRQNSTTYVLEYHPVKEEAGESVAYREFSTTHTATDTTVRFDAATVVEGLYHITTATCIFKAATGSSYAVSVTATDNFFTTTRSTNASTAGTILHWGADGESMGIGKLAENKGVLDIGYKTRFYGGILQSVLPEGTDLNTYLTPNTLSGLNAETAGYINCPISSGRFTLEIMAAGDNEGVTQRITTCSKGGTAIYYRHYYSTQWGAWTSNSGGSSDSGGSGEGGSNDSSGSSEGGDIYIYNNVQPSTFTWWAAINNALGHPDSIDHSNAQTGAFQLNLASGCSFTGFDVINADSFAGLTSLTSAFVRFVVDYYGSGSHKMRLYINCNGVEYESEVYGSMPGLGSEYGMYGFTIPDTIPFSKVATESNSSGSSGGGKTYTEALDLMTFDWMGTVKSALGVTDLDYDSSKVYTGELFLIFSDYCVYLPGSLEYLVRARLDFTVKYAGMGQHTLTLITTYNGKIVTCSFDSSLQDDGSYQFVLTRPYIYFNEVT